MAASREDIAVENDGTVARFPVAEEGNTFEVAQDQGATSRSTEPLTVMLPLSQVSHP